MLSGWWDGASTQPEDNESSLGDDNNANGRLIAGRGSQKTMNPR